jgi:hypothetical protein
MAVTDDLREQIMAIYDLPDWLRERWRAGWRGTPVWMALDWTVQADGYRLVIEDGAMAGLAYDEFPWPWGDPRYDDATVYSWMADGPFPDSAVLVPGALAAQRVTEPPPGLPYRYFGMCGD